MQQPEYLVEARTTPYPSVPGPHAYFKDAVVRAGLSRAEAEAEYKRLVASGRFDSVSVIVKEGTVAHWNAPRGRSRTRTKKTLVPRSARRGR